MNFAASASAKKLYRVEEAVPIINLGRTKIYEQIRLGRLRSVTVGKLRLIPAEYLDEFVELLKREADQRNAATHGENETLTVEPCSGRCLFLGKKT